MLKQAAAVQLPHVRLPAVGADVVCLHRHNVTRGMTELADGECYVRIRSTMWRCCTQAFVQLGRGAATPVPLTTPRNLEVLRAPFFSSALRATMARSLHCKIARGVHAASSAAVRFRSQSPHSSAVFVHACPNPACKANAPQACIWLAAQHEVSGAAGRAKCFEK